MSILCQYGAEWNLNEAGLSNGAVTITLEDVISAYYTVDQWARVKDRYQGLNYDQYVEVFNPVTGNACGNGKRDYSPVPAGASLLEALATSFENLLAIEWNRLWDTYCQCRQPQGDNGERICATSPFCNFGANSELVIFGASYLYPVSSWEAFTGDRVWATNVTAGQTYCLQPFYVETRNGVPHYNIRVESPPGNNLGLAAIDIPGYGAEQRMFQWGLMYRCDGVPVPPTPPPLTPTPIEFKCNETPPTEPISYPLPQSWRDHLEICFPGFDDGEDDVTIIYLPCTPCADGAKGDKGDKGDPGEPGICEDCEVQIETIEVLLPSECAPADGGDGGDGEPPASVSIPVIAGTGSAWQALFDAIAAINSTVCKQTTDPYASATIPGFFDTAGNLIAEPIVLENPNGEAKVSEAEAQINSALDALRSVLTDYIAAVATEHNSP